MSPEVSSKLNLLRQRMAQGNDPTIDEMVEVVKILRQDRKSAAIASAGAKTKAAKQAGPVLDGDALLGEMMS